MAIKQFRIFGLNKFILSCGLILFLFSCNGNKKGKMYSEIIADLTNQSAFIAINVKNQDSIYHIVIKNADFYSILINYLSLEKYKKVVLSSLKSNKPLEVDAAVFFKLNEYRFDNNNKIDSLSAVGVKKILKNDFNKNGVCVAEISDIDERAMIDFLFFNNIYVKVDCETGLLYIANIDYAKCVSP